MFELLALVLFAFPIIAIVALVMALNSRSALQALQARVAKLEAGQAPAEAAAVAPAFAPPPVLTTRPPRAEAPAGEEAPPAVEPAPPPAAPATPAAPPPPRATLEERFGTRWVVWIGGLALALGGIFLVRYSVEQGLLGPGVRIMLAALFAAVLIGAGEWTRRKEVGLDVRAIPTQHIPSILTAAGTVAAYATVYAAFALYGFLSPAVAFILLGLVALATLAAALLHGPALAGLGLAGAFVTPLLVASKEPSYWALYLYLFVVTGAALALARLRLWRWLAITAVALGALWTLPGLEYAHVDALGAHLFHVIAGFALAAALIVCGLLFGPDSEPGAIDDISSGAIGAYLLAATVVAITSLHDPAALAVFSIMIAATVTICWRTAAALYALPAAGLMVVVVMLHWVAPHYAIDLVLPPGPARGAVPDLPTGAGTHIALGAALAALFGAAGFAAQGRSSNAVAGLIWSGTAVVTPIAILIALYLRIAEFDRSIPFAGLALLLAALYGYAAEAVEQARAASGSVPRRLRCSPPARWHRWRWRSPSRSKRAGSPSRSRLMVPGIAWVSEQRPLPALRSLAAAMVVLVLLRVGYEPRIVGNDVGTTPIFNWLLYGYGVPAAAFWYAGHLLRRRADDAPARMADAAAILFTVLLGAPGDPPFHDRRRHLRADHGAHRSRHADLGRPRA